MKLGAAVLSEGGIDHITDRLGGCMIRQHIYQGTQPGSREHLDKFLMEQKHSRAKSKNNLT
ncbi:hypothetical protein DK37_20135 [Halomonas sp. SUBG004]|nr:hypothetical protein DK37_20135 [Halomonas sp. SUBG004]